MTFRTKQAIDFWLGGLLLQGNRVKISSADEAHEKIIVPCGDLAPQAYGVLAGGFSNQVNLTESN